MVLLIPSSLYWCWSWVECWTGWFLLLLMFCILWEWKNSVDPRWWQWYVCSSIAYFYMGEYVYHNMYENSLHGLVCPCIDSTTTHFWFIRVRVIHKKTQQHTATQQHSNTAAQQHTTTQHKSTHIKNSRWTTRFTKDNTVTYNNNEFLWWSARTTCCGSIICRWG